MPELTPDPPPLTPGALAYVCHIFPYLTQTFVYREVEALRRAGIPLTVFSMKPAQPALMSEESRYLLADTVYLPRVTGAAVLASQGVWLLRAPRRYLRALALVARGRYRLNTTVRLWLHGLVDFARGAHLARLLVRDGRYCHLHAQFADDACTTAMVASMLTGMRFSFRSHTSPNPQILLEKMRQAQFVVSASLYDKRVLVHWCGEPLAGKIYVNRLGVPLDRYVPGVGGEGSGVRGQDRPTADSQPLTPDPRPLILSVGTLIPEKGFEYVIRACRILADRGIGYDCLIVGDGPDRAKLQELVRLLDLGDRVTLAPYRPQEELRGLFQQAAVFTLPCIFPLNGNVDVIPLVLQEAMAMARPVVSTPVSGIPELIQDGMNGLLAPEKDHEALAEALARLLGDPELARRLGAAARETVIRRFDVAANGAELAAILRGEVPELGVQAGSTRCAGTRSGGIHRDEQDEQDRQRPERLMRVAWIAEIPVPYRVGLYRRLRDEAGIDLKLFFCSAAQADRDWTVRLEGVPHVVLRGATAAVRPREQFFLRINPQVWPELSRFQPEVVVVGGYAHVTMQLAMLWCRRTRTPYVINSESHGGGTGGRGDGATGRRGDGATGRGGDPASGVPPSPSCPLVPPSRRRLAAALKRFFVRRAAAGLPAGTLARDYLISLGGPAERMFFLPNTCPVDRFARESARARCRRAALRAELGLGPGPVLLFVGRLTPVKGLDTLLQAFRRSGVQAFRADKDGPAFDLAGPERLNPRMPERLNPLPSLLLVGDGEQRGELETLARALGVADRVRFTGSRPWDQLPAFYAAADLLVLPSTFEPWGAVVTEALACGLPVVVSDQVGCAPDLVRPGENGWVVPAGDVGALADVLREAWAAPERLAAMGAASAHPQAPGAGPALRAPARLARWSEDACLEAFVAAVNAASGMRRRSGAQAFRRSGVRGRQ